MTLTRLSLLALAAASFTIAGCFGKDDTGDTNPEADTDTDTDSDTDTDVNYFEPVNYTWGWQGAIIDGQPGTVSSSHSDFTPVFYVDLYAKEYFQAYEERYSCYIWYDASGTIIDKANVGSWPVIPVDLSVPLDTSCENLDPNVWGDDVYAIFSGYAWELSVTSLTSDLADAFLKHWGEAKWEEAQDYVYGAEVSLDGSDMHSIQEGWGYAWPVEDGALDEDGDNVSLKDVAVGADGLYNVQSGYYWGM